MNERELKEAQLFELIYDSDEESWGSALVSDNFDSERARNEWLALQVDLGLLKRDNRLAPQWSLTIAGRKKVELARESFGDRRQWAGALRSQLLVWVDSVVTQTGSLEGSIEQFFVSPMSFFEGQQFTNEETDDAAAYLEQNGLVKRTGAWGAPTLRIGITAPGRDCVINFSGNPTAYLMRRAQEGTTYNIGTAHAVAIAHGDGSSATAVSIQETIDRAVELAEATRQAARILHLDDADMDALDDIESREPSRVKRGLGQIARFTQDSTTGAMGTMLATGALELLKYLN